ncbi:putative P-loop containing nucleoside triphosphate hydrolases superfamily protein [Heracleum sosnowskyi]|uniref:P-loop containing nucleoside triphosphate hydrolases superfamily protein n=1 Tax=Heracleum sosnowskyi TaxID=360622 RepID=A0AAD8MVS2_9APIA|nr:putative P-loop containing nucleoside triphosphate hydrolases superfamily protein [Heracleum sosnowskyi]
MDNQADVIIGITDLRTPPPTTRVRRRLVQSTLFPHTNHDNATVGVDCDRDDDREDDDDDDEEYCGSSQKKNKKTKKTRKAKAITPNLRGSKKVVVTNKEVPSKGIDENESPLTNKSNFFAKVSEKRQQKRQQKEQPCGGSPEKDDKTGLPEDDGKCSSPPDSEANDKKSPPRRKRRCVATPEKRSTGATPKKRRASAPPEKRGKNTTPKKKMKVNGSNDGFSGQMKNPTQDEHTSQLIPNLRLEAKLKAEEISRIYGGKQIHPFFSSRKMVKRNQEEADGENNWSSLDKKDKSITLRPIHVFEQVKDDDFFPDWGQWCFLERTNSFNCDFKYEMSTFYERPVKSLHFDNFLSISGGQSNGSSDHCPIQVDGELLHHSPNKQDCFPNAPYMVLTDAQVSHCETLGEREVSHNMRKVDSCGVDDVCEQNSTFKMIYGHDCLNQPENSLWTNKYQPKLANEICGNGECVHFLNDWLRLWHEKGSGTGKPIGNIHSAQDADCSYTSESDFEDIEEENRLKNVLLITGPVGSGKSAAIYACAKEQGFQVIEVNASDWRNGALVKQRFGEAVESHWLQCSAENPERSDIKHFFKSFPVSSDATVDRGTSNDIVEIIPLSDDELLGDTRMTPTKSVSMKSKTVSEQSGNKTLILFEDVDADLCEDRGFISTIQQLAETAKRPMILTSNSNDPVLPNNLDRLELCFSKPSLKELFCLVSMVCSAEKVTIPPCMGKRFIEFCQGDIRKTILHLQFWCQGQSHIRDRKLFDTYGLMVFDPDAGHNILPKMISSSFTSQLSEIVDKEITKSLLEVEEASCLNAIDVEEPNYDLGRLIFQQNSIDARKEAMLSWHCPDQDGNELPSQLGTACDFSDASDSPIAFGRRSVRRRTDTVLSSESGEECSSDGFPVVPGKLPSEDDSEAHLEVISKGQSRCFAPEMSFNPLAEQLLHSDGEKVEDSCYPCTITEDFGLINGTCRSVDVSCVPESTCVAETQIFSDAVSWGNVDNMAETASVRNDHPLNCINLNISPSGLHEIPVFMANDYDAMTDSVKEEDEMADFHINDADNTSPSGLHEIPVFMANDYDAITDSVKEEDEMADFHINDADIASTKCDLPSNVAESVQEEVADSHVECVRAVPREYQGMDECSRMNFSMRSKYKNQSSLLASETVQETWRKLRNCHMDLKQYATIENNDASKFLKLAHGMSNLISEADVLLSDCQLLTCDYLEPSIFPCETSHSLSWYDDQLDMVSTISEHGMCLYAKHLDAASTNMVSAGRVDLAWEMLASTTNTMALGKLVSQDIKRIQNLEVGLSKSGNLSQRESGSLCSLVQSIIPTRSHLSVKGNALHEYLSSLSQISRSEANRLSENLQKSQRRRLRFAKNYLTTAAPSLNPEDLSLLNQYNCFQKNPHWRISGRSFMPSTDVVSGVSCVHCQAQHQIDGMFRLTGESSRWYKEQEFIIGTNLYMPDSLRRLSDFNFLRPSTVHGHIAPRGMQRATGHLTCTLLALDRNLENRPWTAWWPWTTL